MMKTPSPFLVLLLALSTGLRAQDDGAREPSGGQDAPASRPTGEEPYQPTKVPTPIRWERSLEAAHARSKVDGKPVVAYFTFDT